MAIQIITADQALTVKAIITYIYADPGLGKTSMGFTGDKAISFDFDKGSHRTGELRRGAVVPVQKWTDIGNLTEQDLAPYNTIVLDTVGAMLECIKSYLLSIPNNRQKDNTLKLKAQGAANVMFKNYVHMLISMGKDVVFLAHASEDQNGDQVIYRPDLGGKNRNELYRIADVMGYLTTVRTQEGKTARVINFNPSDTHHAKNAGALGGETGEVWVPDLKENPMFLADLISQAKDHINTLTPAQLAANKAIEEFNNFAQSCEEAVYASDLNQLTESLDKEHIYYHNMRQSMVKRAKELGCVFDKERNAWSNPPEFNAISDAQRDELQDIISLNNLDVKEVCEHLGIDALSAIELSHFSDVKAEITRIAVEGINTEGSYSMTAYLAIMANGESVDAVRIGTHFESLTGEILDPISLINFDQITRDQYAFEADFKKYTLKADFSKYDSLVYRNSLTDAAYKLWRIRGGLPMNDPEYKVIEKDTCIPQSPIYRGRRGES